MRTTYVCLLSGLLISWFFACSSGSDSEASGTGAAAGHAGAGASEAGTTDPGGSGGSAGGTSGSAGQAGGGTGGSAGTNVGGSGGTTPPPDAGELPDVVFEYDAGPDSAPDACASTTVTAEAVPLDLIILLDRSGSMCEPGWDANDLRADCEIGEPTVKDSKWCRSINALMDFFEAPSSVGMGVGFRTFAESRPSYCGAYETLDVDFGVIQGGAGDPLLMALETAMNDAEPQGGTPTEKALRTIIERTLARHLENQASGDPNRKVIGIIVTDGEPQTCNTSRTELNALVVDHYQATGLPTFFIGMEGADYTGLERMAANASGAVHSEYCNPAVATPPDTCYHYDVGDADATVLINALNAIRASVIGCQFAVPEAEVGLVNVDTIAVHFTEREGAPVEVLPRVLGGEIACGTAPGYYADDDDAPTTILLCPETCARAEADPTSSVSIELLCEGS